MLHSIERILRCIRKYTLSTDSSSSKLHIYPKYIHDTDLLHLSVGLYALPFVAQTLEAPHTIVIEQFLRLSSNTDLHKILFLSIAKGVCSLFIPPGWAALAVGFHLISPSSAAY